MEGSNRPPRSGVSRPAVGEPLVYIGNSPPACGSRPTTGWQVGERIVDPYRIPIWEDTPPGAVQLTIGMYDPGTLERLELATPDGLWTGDNFYLGDVEIRER
jgi:hypothetical protein